MDVYDLLNQVEDLDSFLRFARALEQDRRLDGGQVRTRDSAPWQNDSIESFLESAIAWAETTEMGVSQGEAPEQLWKRFAAFLYCGKIYE